MCTSGSGARVTWIVRRSPSSTSRRASGPWSWSAPPTSSSSSSSSSQHRSAKTVNPIFFAKNVLFFSLYLFFQGCQIENLKEVDRCQNQYMMLLFRLVVCHKKNQANLSLQVPSGETWSGKGAWLPFQDHDICPKPVDKHVLNCQMSEHWSW